MEIDIEYKINLTGKYHKGVYYCPFCYFEPDSLHNNSIGFADSNYGNMIVIECPKCFEKWYFHSRIKEYEYSHYSAFLQSIKNNTNIHFKK
jgi:hypothetical protein